MTNARHDRHDSLAPSNDGSGAPATDGADRRWVSTAERGLWLLSQAADGLGSAYHLSIGMRLQGPLDRFALRTALDRLLQRHVALRSHYRSVDGEVERDAIPADAAIFPLVEHDLSGVESAHAECERWIQTETETPFDLRTDTPIRGRLLRIDVQLHVLVLTVHHIAADGRSMQLIAVELGELYSAIVEKRATLLNAPSDYAAFAAWQRRRLSDEQLEQHRAFWKHTLADVPTLQLPTDRPRSARQQYDGSTVACELGTELTCALQRLRDDSNVSLFTVLLAGWFVTLGRMGGQRDFAVGVGIDQRPAEAERLVGYCVSTMPVRVDLSGAPTVRELLRRVTEQLHRAREFQALPFDEIVAAAAPERDPRYHPLYQSGFSWFRVVGDGPAFAGLAVTPLLGQQQRHAVDCADAAPGAPLGHGAFAAVASSGTCFDRGSKFDLAPHVWLTGGRISGNIEYAKALFEDTTVERIQTLWQRVLQAMAADPSSTIDQLPLLTAAELRRLTVDWARGADLPVVERCALEMFEKHAAQSPDRPALQQGEWVLSYGELDRRANHLALQMRAYDVGPEQVVAICAPRGPATMLAVFAAWKAGAAYLPLDPHYPAERLRASCSDAGARLLLHSEPVGWADPLTTLPRLAFDVSVDAGEPVAELRRRDVGLRPDHLAYVIFTSGSTGRPKGVMITQRMLANTVAAFGHVLAIGPGARVLQAASFCFDMSVFEYTTALCHGGTLCFAPSGELPIGRALAAALSEGECTHAFLTPSAAATLEDGDALAHLECLLLGGEAVSPELAARLARPGLELVNAYGPTEATIVATLQRASESERHCFPIGRPLPGYRCYVLDEQWQPQPIGAIGELYIGGAAVARGYLGQPERTAERFLPDPFAGTEGDRMYATGDRVRWRADGTLEYLGRTDDQLKIRGFRIEPGEIAAAIGRHAGVRNAAVLARPGPGGDLRVVAYVDADATLDRDALRRHLESELPSHMQPGAIVRLDRLPLTINGKLDRRALPPLDDGAFADAHDDPPASATELLVASIWCTLLGRDRVGRQDHFFRLGGHSLLAAQAIVRIRESLNVELPLGVMFEHPRLADLARAVDGSIGSRLPPITPVARQPLMPVSFAQQRLWFIAQLSRAANRAYTLPFAMRLSGRLDEAALRWALDRLVQRHEALRTTFVAVDGQPMQRIAEDHGRFPLAIVDLRECVDPQAEAERHIRDEADGPFDLERGPLIRGRLLQVADDEHVLLLTQHHIVSDGWSVGVLIDELNRLYRGGVLGDRDPLPPLPVQYADFAVWQRRWIEGSELQRQSDYWATQLAGAPPVSSLPSDRPRPAVLDYAGGWIEFELDAELTTALRALATRHQATMFMTTLASWAVLMSRLSGQSDVVIGSPTANRVRRDLEPLIGFFVNALALRFDLSGQPTFSAVLAQAKRCALDGLQNQDIPFEQVVERLQPERSLGHNPLFQVAFAWQNAPHTELELPGLRLIPMRRADHVSAIFDLSVHLWERGSEIVGAVEYAGALFDRATVQRFIAHWRVLLAAIAADPERPIARLPLLDDEQRRQLLHELARDPALPIPDLRVHQRIAMHAGERPEAIAAICGEQTLTYYELQVWSGGVAARLRAAGVKPGDRVAVCLPRGLPLLAGLLGVMRCGAAYVPLDPGQPEQRLRFLLGDCSPTAALVCPSVRSALPAAWAAPLLDPAAERGPGGGDGADAAFDAMVGPNEAAYVIYTSGSTGAPKGVVVEHRGLSNLCEWHRVTFSVGDGTRSTCVAGLGFDACAWEIWSTWWAGATLHLPPPACAGDPERLLEWWCTQPIDVSFLPTALAEIAFERDLLNRRLRTLLIGGDALRHLPALPASLQLYNNYGPTEAAVVTTSGRLDAGGEAIHVGRPIANATVYILDQAMEPVPIGVVGELWIGGVGVARGYLDRVEMTAERFVADPFDPTGSARIYRSGDLARWRADGTIEVVGRADSQIKLRGFRIELGEIEHQLVAMPEVGHAAVVAVDEANGARRLVAYVSPAAAAAPALSELSELSEQQSGEWQTFYDATYAESPNASQLTDFVGWNSSYDGTPIPAGEMAEWRAETLQRIRALRPRRVLEIGCGSGLLLLELAGECESYVASDFSAAALAAVEKRLQRIGLRNTSLLHRAADDFSELGEQRFDTIILNSVVQYFPSADYLRRVLESALALLTDDGVLFVGDVRNHRLLSAFHSSVQLRRAADDDDLRTIAARVKEETIAERELLVAPEFFLQQGAGAVRALLKGHACDNELSRYRYDVVLHRTPLPAIAPDARFDYREIGNEHALAELLQNGPGDSLLLVDIGNPRTLRDAVHAAELLASDAPPERTRAELLHADEGRADGPTLDPRRLVRIAGEAEFTVETSWLGSGPDGRYHALLLRRSRHRQPGAIALEWLPHRHDHGSDPLTNEPLQEVLHGRLIEAVRQRLEAQLPDYMVPSQFVVLERLPLSANGKVDRRALPAPGRARAIAAYVEPRSPTERIVAPLWAAALRVDKVGADDNFFELGGHSLLAVQVVNRVRETLLVDVGVTTLFANPELSGFCRCIDAADRVASEPIVPTPRTEPPPLSFAQQRLWLLSSLGTAANAAYNIPVAVRLRGPLDTAALQRSLQRLIDRHEPLRTLFRLVEGEPVQWVLMPGDAVVSVSEVTAHDEAALARLLSDEATRPFDLERELPLRALLVRCRPDEHVLLLNLHHICADGWSMGVLTDELNKLYRSETGGPPAQLPALPIQYADYALWQRRSLVGLRTQRHRAYWQSQLAGAPQPLALPLDRPRPPVQNHAGDTVPFRFERSLSEAVRTMAAEGGTTPFVVLLAGWSVWLSRWCGQNDIVIGTPTANRGAPELEQLIGFFVNMLALRLRPQRESSGRDWLDAVGATVTAAIEHQELPFEQVVEAVRPERSIAYSPLFQVGFAWQEAAAPLRLGALHAEAIDLSPALANYDLTLLVSEDADGLFGVVNYATALFDRTTIERQLDSWRTFLAAMTRSPKTAVGRLPLLDGAARASLLTELAAGPCAPPSDLFITEWIAWYASRAPDAPALVQDGQSLSYAELDAAAERMAQALLGLGIGPEQLVAVCMPRSTTLLISVLGVLKAGAAFLPLDPTYPVERLRFMLQDSGAVRLLVDDTRPAWVDSTPVSDATELLRNGGGGSVRRPVAARPDQLAYVIYTSGSTGQPKGVAIERGNWSNLITIERDTFAVTPDSRVLQWASPAFDAFVFEISLAFCNGAALFLPPSRTVMIGDSLAQLIRARRITHAVLTPAALATVQRRDDLDTVHVLMVAGEALPAELASHWSHGRTLMNCYGPTEATVIATAHHCVGAVDTAPSIGRPLANVRTYVLDEAGEPAPIGVIGELCIAGAGVARGYLGRPELDAQRFVAEPGVRSPAGRMYRTGDLARWRPDGTLEFVGRNDGQVKLRGLRIELGEIEAALRRHPGVDEAVVVLRDYAPGDHRLVAYWLPASRDSATRAAPAGAPDPGALREHLMMQLPEFMVPAAFVRLDDLPLTANGKLDRRALPLPPLAAYARQHFEPPQGELEGAIAQIWTDITGCERLGRHDDFFAIGGHSLAIARVAERLRRSGIDTELEPLFRHTTIESLAAHLRARSGQPERRDVPIPLREGTTPALFFFPDGSGELFYAHALSRALGSRRATFGLPAAEPMERQETVEQMAERFVAMIRSVQPDGPYALAGWSFGGLLAYEAAAQLVREGRAVDLVALFDTYYCSDGPLTATERDLKHQFLALLEVEALQNHERLDAYEALQRLADDVDVAELLTRCRDTRPRLLPAHLAELPLPELRAYLLRQQRLQTAALRYRPPPIALDVDLFVAAEPIAPLAPSTDQRWCLLQPDRCRRYDVRGNHYSMMRTPNVESLAEQLAGRGNGAKRAF